MRPLLSQALRGALDLILPPEAYDGGPRPMTSGLSASGWTSIRFLDDPVCDGCGAPFDYPLGFGARCPACLARPRAFDRARAACLYDERSRGLILQLKHADRPELGTLMARWISRAASELVEEAELLAPVPLHPVRLFQRRYNQSAEIARALARQWRRGYAPEALKRRRATPSQGGRSAVGRRRNVSGAFLADPAVAGRRILLVDDVMTTGATLEACAKALKKAGAQSVSVAVVARVQDAANPTI